LTDEDANSCDSISDYGLPPLERNLNRLNFEESVEESKSEDIKSKLRSMRFFHGYKS